MKHEYGVGKTSLILAEFYIEKSFGSGLDIYLDPKEIKKLLKKAIETFSNLNYEYLEARSLR